MRISRISIKGYRSIFNIEDFRFLDDQITCFIGPNGSGKSNILRAIAAVLSNQSFNQQDYFEKEGPKEIAIEIELSLEPADRELLDTDSKLGKQLLGVLLSCKEKYGDGPIRTVQPIVRSSDHIDLSKEGLLALFKQLKDRRSSVDLRSLVGPDTVSDIESRVDSNINGSVSKLTGDDYSIDAEVEQLIDLFSTIEGTKPGIKPKEVREIDNDLAQIKKLITLRKSLDVVKNSLAIELLDFTEYEVEEEVDPNKLKDRNLHPFLYDLLSRP